MLQKLTVTAALVLLAHTKYGTGIQVGDCTLCDDTRHSSAWVLGLSTWGHADASHATHQPPRCLCSHSALRPGFLMRSQVPVALAVVLVGLISHLVLRPYRKALLQNLKTLTDTAIVLNLYLSLVWRSR